MSIHNRETDNVIKVWGVNSQPHFWSNARDDELLSR